MINYSGSAAIPESAIVDGQKTPRYDANGLLIGYGNPNQTSRYASTGQTDFPTIGTDGTIIGYHSRTPYTGRYGNTQIRNGQQLVLDPVTGSYMPQAAIDQRNAKIQNDPNARYQAVNVDKNPDISSATSDLVKQFKDTAENSLKDFKDYLGNFQNDVASARGAGKAATDIGETVGNLRKYQADYTGDLDNASSRYRSALDSGQAQENNIVTQAQNELPAYDTAAQAVADREQQAMQAQLSRYKLSTGTPGNLGSDEEKILAAGVQNIQLPTQLAKIQRRYDVLGNYALPVARDVTGQNVQYAGSFLPSVAGSKFGANVGTENGIQNLKMQVANMSFDDATRYMQSLGIPWAIQASILQGGVGALSGLNALESGSRYQGLQDRLGVNVTAPQGSAFVAPTPPTYGASYPNRYSTAGATPTYTTTGTADNLQPLSPDMQALATNPMDLMGFGANKNNSRDYYDTAGTGLSEGSYFA